MPADNSTTRIITALRNARKRIELLESKKAVPIAIVGIGCRFPGAGRGSDALWRLLKSGRDAISNIPRDRWQFSDLFDPTPGRSGRFYSLAGGFLDEISGFDANFFGMSRIEAERTDPQQRLLLETGYEALEDAGIYWDRREGRDACVFVGATNNDYGSLIIEAKDAKLIDPYFATGNPLNCLAGRIAYWLGARGSCMTVDTACSSSMVAVALACRELRNGQSGLAIAAGVNLILSPTPTIALAQAQMLARDGRCKAFDARADGFVRGEGCAVLILKRLPDALDSGDRIYGVIRGISINHNGAGAGFMVPSVGAQKQAIEDALKEAAIAPDTVDFVEAHGTGTALGDPIEFEALNQVYGRRDANSAPLWLGSLKTNIGHTEAVAGIAGLIKTVLCLKHKEVPPSLHFETPNPAIDWLHSPIKVATKTEALGSSSRPLRGACSSFGASGVNVHAVVEAVEEVSVTQARESGVLFVSGFTAEACAALSVRLAEHLSIPGVQIQNIAVTLAKRRREFNFRRALFFRSQKDAIEKLRMAGASPRSCRDGQSFVAALLLGGREIDPALRLAPIHAEFPVFAQHIHDCVDILERLGKGMLGRAIADRIAGDVLENASTEFGGTVLFIVQSALIRLLRESGVICHDVRASEIGSVTAEWYAERVTLEVALSRCLQGEIGPTSSVPSSATGDLKQVPLCRIDLCPSSASRSAFAIGDGSTEFHLLATASNPVEETYGVLAHLWEHGCSIDRDQVTSSWRGKITDLPLYPFEDNRYWALPLSAPERVGGDVSDKNQGKAAYVYSTAWSTDGGSTDQSLTQEGCPAAAVGFSTDERELLNQLPGIRHIGFEDYELDPAERIVLWRWKAPVEGTSRLTPNTVREKVTAMLLQLQQWIKRSAERAIGVILLSSDEFALDRQAHHSALLEVLRAFATVAAAEAQRFFFRVVDLDNIARTQLAAILRAECNSPRFGEVVLYHEGRRFIRTYQQVRLPEISARNEAVQGAVYLITGGLGNIGRAIAERLIERHQAKVILTSRHASWAESTVDQSDSRRNAFLRKYYGHPAIGLIAINVSTSAGIEQAIGECLRRYGRLDGIIHSAGIVSGEKLKTAAETTPDDLTRHFQTKLDTVNAISTALERATVKPRVVILMSSISTVLGGLGHAAYAAANACCAPAASSLDRRDANTRWLSIEWDTWTFAQQENDRFDVAALPVVTALDTLESVLAHWPNQTSVVVAAGRLESRIDAWVTKTFAINEPRPVSAETPRDKSHVGQAIVNTCRELLECDAVPLDANFFELGGDSLTAAKFVSLVQERLGTTLTIQQLLTAATMGALIDSLHGQIALRDAQGVVEIEI